LFQEIISTSVQIWKHKIHQFTRSNPQYKHILSNTEYPEIKKLAAKLRKFYSSLLKINENIVNGNFKRIKFTAWMQN